MSSGWRNTLALAATAALSLGSPDQAQATGSGEHLAVLRDQNRAGHSGI